MLGNLHCRCGGSWHPDSTGIVIEWQVLSKVITSHVDHYALGCGVLLTQLCRTSLREIYNSIANLTFFTYYMTEGSRVHNSLVVDVNRVDCYAINAH